MSEKEIEKKAGEKCADGNCCESKFMKKYGDYLVPGIVVVALIFGLIFVVVKNGSFMKDGEEKPLSEKVSKEVESRVLEAFGGAYPDMKFNKFTEDSFNKSDWYKVNITVQGQTVDIYLSKDKSNLILSMIDIDEQLKKIEEEKKDKEKLNISTKDLLGKTAEELSLDKVAFEKCIAEGRYTEKIGASIEEGQKAGVNGTPHNVMIVNGVQYELAGALAEEKIIEVLDTALIGGMLDLEKSKVNVKSVDVNDHTRGNKASRVVFVEYSDVDCPYCKKHHETMEKVVAKYGDRVQFVFRAFPLEMHPNARPKSEAAECANELGGEEAYWKYLDKMFKSN